MEQIQQFQADNATKYIPLYNSEFLMQVAFLAEWWTYNYGNAKSI